MANAHGEREDEFTTHASAVRARRKPACCYDGSFGPRASLNRASPRQADLATEKSQPDEVTLVSARLRLGGRAQVRSELARRRKGKVVMNADEFALRRRIIEACLTMNARGFNQGKSGNVSVRFGESILITPTSLPYEQLTPEDLAQMPINGEYGSWVGPHAPSTEWRFHLDIVRSRPEVGAIVHTHSLYATVLGICGREIPAIHYMIVDVRWANSARLPRTRPSARRNCPTTSSRRWRGATPVCSPITARSLSVLTSGTPSLWRRSSRIWRGNTFSLLGLAARKSCPKTKSRG